MSVSMTATARVTTISFATDSTKETAAAIPLGFMIEATWPDQIRWLGLIGRTRLTVGEIHRVNLLTWPELEKPFDMLGRLFDKGWAAGWGEAGAAIAQDWASSALRVSTIDKHGLLDGSRIETDVEWATTVVMLDAHLTSLGLQLSPIIEPTAPLPRRKPTIKLGRPIFVPDAPKGRRTEEDFAHTLEAA